LSNGYSGNNCQINILECSSSPCHNGGTCIDGIDSFSCICLHGVIGIHCETNLNDCISSPCINGICLDGIDSYLCNCIPGYTGYSCESDYDECLSNPCQNGALCTDLLNHFDCSCLPPYGGVVCADLPLFGDGTQASSLSPRDIGLVSGGSILFFILAGACCYFVIRRRRLLKKLVKTLGTLEEHPHAHGHQTHKKSVQLSGVIITPSPRIEPPIDSTRVVAALTGSDIPDG